MSTGQMVDAQNMVDALKKNVLLVADLIATLHLGDSSAPLSPTPRSIPSGPRIDLSSQSLLNQQPPFSPTPSTAPTEPHLVPDSSDMSRKRCASSVANDRVVKALKLEPQEDIPLQSLPIVIPIQPLAPSFPFSSASMTSIVEQASLPPSVPASRPQTPPRLSHSSLNLLQDLQHPNASIHTPLHYPPHTIESLQSIPHSVPDFVNVSSAQISAPTPVSAGFASAPLTSSTWPDSRQGFPRHQHTLSGGPVMAGVPHPGLTVAPGGPSNLQYSPSQVVYTSPTRTAHPSQPLPNTVSNSAAAFVGMRSSRSSSISHPNPFAYSPEAAASVFEAMHSRPSTSGIYSTAPSSPDYEDDADGEGDSDEEGNYQSPPRDGSQTEDANNTGAGGDPNMEGIQSSSFQTGTGRRLSRTSPPSEGGGSAPHVNEVPSEYRAEVERIFFEFLTKTCSNRKNHPFLTLLHRSGSLPLLFLSVDATDTKGEPIHQTLMAKKMQRLDESPDFRPFKFRIQAFTNAFLEEVCNCRELHYVI